MFERNSKGDPLKVIAELVTKLTFDEMHQLAAGLGADPKKINDWGKGYGNPLGAQMPQSLVEKAGETIANALKPPVAIPTTP